MFGKGGILGTRYGRQPYRPYVADITVEHLLTHTAGGWSNKQRDPMFGNPHMNHAQLISWTLDNVALTNPPGTAHAYSNFGYCVLGRVIEKITGQPYGNCVNTAVLGRCGISGMRIAGNTRAQRAPDEVRYYPDGNPYGMNVTRTDARWVCDIGPRMVKPSPR